MKPDPNLEQIAKLATLLDESTDVNAFDDAMEQLELQPALMDSLMALQFVRDAMQGNPCPDKHYTARIMQFIAEAEQRRLADEQGNG